MNKITVTFKKREAEKVKPYSVLLKVVSLVIGTLL